MESDAVGLCLMLPCLLLAGLAASGLGGPVDPSDPSALRPPPAGAVGFPSRAADLDALPGFASPPPGYGEVPYYWWNGDPLTKERLAWQLDQLSAKGILGLQVNYCHAKGGGGGFGMTYASDPPLFSDGWWDLWKWVVGECRKRNMAIGLSDYTLAWPGNGQWIDEIMAQPPLRGAHLEQRSVQAAGGKALQIEVPKDLLSVMAYPIRGGTLDGSAAGDLRPRVNGKSLTWTPPEGTWQIVMVSFRVVPRSVDPMNPEVGRQLVQRHFQRFEDHSPGEGGRGLNYFFQDELMFGIGGNLWTARFAEEFRKRKGYDLIPLLPALFHDIGPMTPKVRLDYSDVMVALSEEGYFRPIFDWHWSRGMLYGCDQCSRGRDVREYGDYFRCVRWFTAPGHDTPGVAADIIKGKVSSSIAHLYLRPRVWLEGYHSAGWGATLAGLMQATRENFVYGCSLLNLHGLYYTTHGGWWEWAPPCYHFRMPYWQHMDTWLRYFDRLSYLLSQGVHRCDVAILYPVAPMEAGMHGNEAVQAAFSIGPELFRHGIDFDFMDFQSLARAQVQDKELRVSGEAYRVLILPAMAAVRHSTLQQALSFYRAGGVVIATGCLPEASDRAGRDDAELDATVKEIFGLTAKEFQQGKSPAPQRNAAGGVGVLAVDAPPTPEDIKKASEGRWVWSAEATPRVYFKAVWPPNAGKGPFEANIKCDNECTVFVNDRKIAHFADYTKGWNGRLDLKEGDVLTVDGLDHDEGNKTAGLFVTIAKGGRILLTERDFKYSLQPPDAAWRTSRDLSKLRNVDPTNVHPAHKGKGQGAPIAGTPLDRVREIIDRSIARDFIPDAPAQVLHRKVGPRDVYMVLNAPQSSECLFRAKGKVELWDPWTGKASPIHTFAQTDQGTRVRLPLEAYEARLIVFSPGDPGIAVEKTDLDEVSEVKAEGEGITVQGFSEKAGKKSATVRKDGKLIELQGEAAASPESVVLDGLWDFELKPTMDNRFGDFRIPATNTIIGAEARQFRYSWEGEAPAEPSRRDETARQEPRPPWQAPDLDDSKWQVTTCSFGPRFWQLGPLQPGTDAAAIASRLVALASIDPAAPVAIGEQRHAWRLYYYSLRWGIEGDPGEQGYHGLKEIVTDAFISVQANTWLWTAVRLAARTRVRILVGGPPPSGVWINGSRVANLAEPVTLNPGVNRVLLHYANASRGYFVVQAADAPQDSPRFPLAMSWYTKPGVLLCDPMPERTQHIGWYRFTAPPGLRSMTVYAHGKVSAWVNGELCLPLPRTPSGPPSRRNKGAKDAEGAWFALFAVRPPASGMVKVALRIEQEPGCYAGAALPEPIALDCGPGQAPLGDWSKMGALAAYSGGAWYRKKVTLSPEQANGQVTLQLGSVAATAEVHVNGRLAGIRVAPPWSLDISALAKPGENQIEVLVYNTLANHYSTIPTHYRGSPLSGLLGPVRIETRVPVVLRAAR